MDMITYWCYLLINLRSFIVFQGPLYFPSLSQIQKKLDNMFAFYVNLVGMQNEEIKPHFKGSYLRNAQHDYFQI